MALVFGDDRDDGGHFDGLKAGRLRVGGRRRRGKGGVTVFALGGSEDHDLIDPFERKRLFQMGWVAGLTTATTFGLFLGDRLGSVEGIGRRRHGGVGTVGVEPCFEVANTPFQLGDASEMSEASRAGYDFHVRMLASRIAFGVRIDKKSGERLRAVDRNTRENHSNYRPARDRIVTNDNAAEFGDCFNRLNLGCFGRLRGWID